MAVKTVTIAPGIDPGLLDLIRQVGPTVEAVLGDALDRVEVAWEPGAEDRDGEPTARVRVTDEGVSRSAEFGPWDLDDESLFRRRFRRLWVQVMAERTAQQLDRVFAALPLTAEAE